MTTQEVLERALNELQNCFEEGYNQCFKEVLEEIETWEHPDKKSFTIRLKKAFDKK